MPREITGTVLSGGSRNTIPEREIREARFPVIRVANRPGDGRAITGVFMGEWALLVVILLLGWHLSKTLSDLADKKAIADQRHTESLLEELRSLWRKLDEISFDAGDRRDA